MKDKIKKAGGIGLKVIGTWILYFGLGIILSIIGLIIAVSLYYGSDMGDVIAFSSNSITSAFTAALSYPFWLVLVISSVIVFPILYFTLVNKLTIQKTIKSILDAGLRKQIEGLLLKYLKKANDIQPDFIHNLKDVSKLKLKLLNSLKEDESIADWQRKIIAIGFEKANLEGLNFDRDELSFSEYVTSKAMDALDEFADPSKKMILIAYAIHVLVIILALVF